MGYMLPNGRWTDSGRPRHSSGASASRGSVGVQVVGLKELNDALKKLPLAVSKRVLVQALKAGAAPMIMAAKLAAPVLEQPDRRRTSGTVRDSIKATVRRDGEGHTALIVVKPKRLSNKVVTLFRMATGKKGGDNPRDPFYWWFIEFGTRFQAARPFLRPAFEAHKEEALRIIRAELGERLQVAWAKLGRA